MGPKLDIWGDPMERIVEQVEEEDVEDTDAIAGDREVGYPS